jgi:general secretion pathway protein F
VKTYAYKGYDNTGAVRRGLVEALDLKEAREKLSARGVLPEEVTPAEHEARGEGFRVGRQGFGAEARVAFYREMSVLMVSGMPLVNALEILIEAPELGASATMMAGVRDRIREGASLATALSEASASVKPFERAILEVGERSGSLEAMLDRLAGFLEEQQLLHERVLSAMIYPGIIIGFAIVVAMVMLGVVVPSAAKVLGEHGGASLPLLTRVMMGIGRVMLWGAPVLALVGVFVVSYVRRRLAADLEWRCRVDRMLFRVPVIGRGYTIVANLRCARTLAILLKGGVGMVEALALAGRATGSAWVGRLAEEESKAVRHGSSLADAIRRIPPLAAALPAWIQAGEASGSLEKLLETAGTAMQQRWNRFVTRTLSWLEPVLIFSVGAFVLLVVLSVLLPIVSLNKLIGG